MPNALTLHLPDTLSAAIEDAVTTGAYPSAAAVVQEALSQWQHRRAALEADLAEGFADLAAGRTAPFDLDRILAEGALRSSRSV